MTKPSAEIISKNIEKASPAELASDLVKIKSHSDMERPEEEIAAFIGEYFRRRKIETWTNEISPGRYNVFARLPGKKTIDSKPLMLCGHMDTVPAYDMKDAFSGRMKDGVLYGRGSCDMKGAVAAMMTVMSAFKESEIELDNDLLFSALADEEQTGTGVEAMVKSGPTATAVIVGEPTNLEICIGQKGLEWIRTTITGKKVHGGNMEKGVNAIAMSRFFMNRIMDDYVDVLNGREHPILGKPSINFGTICGGDQPSTVPDFCEMTLDRRYVTGETREQVYEELIDIIDKIKDEEPTFSAKIESVFGETEMLPHNPFYTVEDSLIVVTATSVYRNINASEPKLRPFPAWTDAGIIHEFMGSDCIILGPGDISFAHSAEERIYIEDITKAAHIYGRIALEWNDL